MSWWNKYENVPFEEKGRSMAGADCWGLVKLVYEQELGIILPSYLECYETTTDRDVLGLLIAEERNSKWSEPASPETLDVIILKVHGLPCHVGLVTKPNHVLHCQLGVGTTHEPFTSMRWKNKVIGFARHER